MISILFILIIFVCLIYISIVDSVFFSILISGIISFVFVIFYLIFKAPDIALTEMSIGSSVSTLLFATALLIINNQRLDKSKHKNIINNIERKIIFLILAVLVFYFISDVVSELPIKKNTLDSGSNLGEWYILNASQTFHIPSIVTSIIVGFRALDTFFETLVIISASYVFVKVLKNKEL